MKYVFLVFGFLLLMPLSAQSVEYHWNNAAGEKVSLESMKGEPVVLHFWASWCPPCRTEMPEMSKWVQEHGDVNVVIISLDGDQEDAAEFYAAKGIQGPLNMGNMRETSRLGVRGLPTTVIIDGNGDVTKRHLGDIKWQDAEKSQEVLSWL
jgi:thiol-disulfide isomerase/thioredoxin